MRLLIIDRNGNATQADTQINKQTKQQNPHIKLIKTRTTLTGTECFEQLNSETGEWEDIPTTDLETNQNENKKSITLVKLLRRALKQSQNTATQSLLKEALELLQPDLNTTL